MMRSKENNSTYLLKFRRHCHSVSGGTIVQKINDKKKL